jgi:hypothetical protein
MTSYLELVTSVPDIIVTQCPDKAALIPRATASAEAPSLPARLLFMQRSALAKRHGQSYSPIVTNNPMILPLTGDSWSKRALVDLLGSGLSDAEYHSCWLEEVRQWRQ